MPISEIMTHPVTTLGLNDPIALAGAHFDSGGFHHLPVVNCDRKVLGIVCQHDYSHVVDHSPDKDAAQQGSENLREKVHTIMSLNVVTTQLDTPIGEVAELLIQNKFSSVLVVDKNNILRGIVTWKDVVKFVAEFPQLDIRDGEILAPTS